MIVEKSNDIEQLGQLKGETIQMGFAQEAIGELMDNMARSLYSRPKEAVLREYSTNALDAQIEVGVTRPIEITLPSALNPILCIRDFGVGLDRESLHKVYSQYGASTKRLSNDFNGTLGLGSKSAFAYSNRFTVVSIKNGVREEIVVTRNEDGTAEMVVMDPSLTDEHSGTTIKIPTKRGDTFQAEADKLYQWFPKDTVKVNGHSQFPWDREAEGNLEVAPNLFVVKNREQGYRTIEEDDLIVMGNVAYPTRLDNTGLQRSKYHLVVFVPNGAVNFMTSREALQMNNVTRTKLDDITTQFKYAMRTTIQKHINAAPSHSEAARVVSDWKSLVPSNVIPAGGWEYKGEPIPLKLTLPFTEPYLRLLPTEKNGYHNSHDKRRDLGLHYFPSTLWVEGFTVDKVTATHGQKARKYVADNKIDAARGIILVGAIPPEIKPWLANIITYDNLKAVKLPRETTASYASGRIPGSYDLFTSRQAEIAKHWGTSAARHTYAQRSGVDAEEFRHWAEPLFFMVGNTYEAGNARIALAAVSGQKGYTLVCLRADRVAKFQRNFPAARNATVAIKEGYEAWKTGVGKDVPLALAVQSRTYLARLLRTLTPRQVDDPKLRQYVELAKKDLTNERQAVTVFQRVIGVVDGRVVATDIIEFDELYPLMSEDSPEHNIVYVNAVYSARQSGAKL